MKNVTIVVPVYGDWPSLKDCIKSLITHVTSQHTIMLVNDCGPEADKIEFEIKKIIKGRINFKYFRNETNLGFVGTCNRAVFDLEKTKNDILLLNSDTEVSPGFLEEMEAVLWSSDEIGVVSPRSNNATLTTFPISSIPTRGLQPATSYKLFINHAHTLPRYNEAPTAHGFCMLIKRKVIKKYGLFDDAFGKGYGEEVDFCQRIRQKNIKPVISNWSYVFHLEARSFSLEKKQLILDQNNKIITKRYPKYKQEVRDYLDKITHQERIAGLNPKRIIRPAWVPKLKNRLSKKQNTTLGVLGAVLIFVSTSGFFSVVTPWWLGKGDAPRHIDYVFRVYKRELPSFEDGFRTPIIKDLAKGIYIGQPAASNPPFFYMINAPIMGPFLAKGEWREAIALGRVINITIGIFCILVLAWAGWIIGGTENGHNFAVGFSGIGAIAYQLNILNVNFAIDGLLTLITTLTMCVLIQIYKQGLTRKWVIALIVFSILGMATKVTYSIFFLLTIVFLLLLPVVRNNYSLGIKKISGDWVTKKSLIACLLLVISIVITTGYFFYYKHNYMSTGSFLTAIPLDYPSTRKVKTLFDVVTGSPLWSLLYSAYTAVPVLTVVIVTIATLGHTSFRNNKVKVKLAPGVILLAFFLGTFLGQIMFAKGTGAINFRYMLPSLLPFVVYIYLGFNNFKHSGRITATFTFLCSTAIIYRSSRIDTLDYNLPGLKEVASSLHKSVVMVGQNNIPRYTIVILLLLLFFGNMLYFISQIGFNEEENYHK